MSNAERQPRSNSMIGKTIPVSDRKQSPIDGSFICVDERKRKLSDMGNYRNIGRNSGINFAPVVPGPTVTSNGLFERKERFVSNF